MHVPSPAVVRFLLENFWGDVALGAKDYTCQIEPFPSCSDFAQKWESSVEGSERGRLTR